jgi:hypothetical protein
VSVNLHLPWTVDKEPAEDHNGYEARIVVSDTEGSIAFLTLFSPIADPGAEDSEAYARAVAQAICDRMNGK